MIVVFIVSFPCLGCLDPQTRCPRVSPSHGSSVGLSNLYVFNLDVFNLIVSTSKHRKLDHFWRLEVSHKLSGIFLPPKWPLAFADHSQIAHLSFVGFIPSYVDNCCIHRLVPLFKLCCPLVMYVSYRLSDRLTIAETLDSARFYLSQALTR